MDNHIQVEYTKELETVLGKLDKITLKQASTLFNAWQNKHFEQLQSCEIICKNGQNSLFVLFEIDFSSLNYWQELDAFVHQLLDWLQGLDTTETDLFTIPSREAFETKYNKVINGCPDNLELQITDQWWKALADDTLRINMWKWLNRRRHAIQRNNLKLGNKIRGWSKKSAKALQQETRTINMQAFLQYYYTSSIYPLMIQKSSQCHQHIVSNYEKLHHTVNSLLDTLFAIQEFQTTLETGSPSLLRQKASTAENSIQEIQALLSDQKTILDQIQDDLKSGLDSSNAKLIKNWNYAGTALLPAPVFHSNKTESQWQKNQQALDKSFNRWKSVLESEKQDWKKDLELSQLQIHTIITSVETIETLHQKIFEHILPTFQDPRSMLQDALEKFKDMEQNPNAELKKEILSENRMTIRTLRREKIPKIVDTMQQAQILKTLENYLSRIRYNAEKLPERQSILDAKEKKIAEVPLKALMMEEVFPKLAQSHAQIMSEIQQKTDKIIRDILEVDQIVEFNFIAALDVLEQEQAGNQESIKVVIEGLTRANNQFSTLADNCTEINQIARDWLIKSTFSFQSQVHELENSEKINELQIRVAKAHTRDKIRQYKNNFFTSLKKLLPAAILFMRNSFQSINSNYQNIKKITGLGTIQPDSEQRITRFLHDSQKQLDKMPYVYQRLFRPAPLDDERFFAGRDTELEKIKDIFANWKTHPYSATAIVGENGSGRTTLLHFAESQVFRGYPVMKLELNKTITKPEDLFTRLSETLTQFDAETLDTLETEINSSDNRLVCIVENAHKLFLRTVNGFEALERFLLFVSRTQQKIFWVITFGIYSWKYLNKSIGISRYLGNIITLSDMPLSQIEAIILKRHRVSGYRLQFEGEPALLESRKYKKLASEELQQEFLKNVYFEQLNRQSLGNITVALLLWLLSIREIKEDKLIISPIIEYDVSFLQQISQDIVFTFAAFLQHHILNEAEYAAIFRTNNQNSTMQLENLRNKGLLTKGPNGYQLHHLIYRPVVKNLKMNNILQE